MSELKKAIDSLEILSKEENEKIENLRRKFLDIEKRIEVLKNTREVSNKDFYSEIEKYINTENVIFDVEYNEPIIEIKKGFFLTDNQIQICYKYLIDVLEIKPKKYKQVIQYKMQNIDFAIEKPEWI